MTILGGFAAPLFLWLAGVALVFSAASAARREGSRAAGAEAVCRRGLEIFMLAFLFRLQASSSRPGGYPVTLFRVDILNIMGPSIVVAGLVWGSPERPRGLWRRVRGDGDRRGAADAGRSRQLAGERSADLGAVVLQARSPKPTFTRCRGQDSCSPAPPWEPCSCSLARTRASGDSRSSLAAVGGSLVAAGFYAATLPTIYRESSFWTSSPAFFAIRVGVLMLAFAAIYALAHLAGRHGIELRPLERFGRSSLFVYWIHVELVYGYVSWPLHARLPLWGSCSWRMRCLRR